MKILNLLSSDSYLLVNKRILKEFGADCAVFICELANEYNYFFNSKKIDSDGYFYSTIENVEKATGLSKHKQKKCIDRLKEEKLIDMQVRGVPAKRFFKINEEVLERYLSFPKSGNKKVKNLSHSLPKNGKLVGKEFTTNNNNNNINNINKIEKEKERGISDFQKPTYDQINDYILKNKMTMIDIDKFINYYDAKDWFLGSTKMHNWKAVVNLWCSNKKTSHRCDEAYEHDNDDIPVLDTDRDDLLKMIQEVNKL